jgi:hypothetical protein
VWIHGRDLDEVEIFGDVPAIDAPEANPLRLCAIVGDSKTARASIVHGSRWSIDVPPGVGCVLWLERGTRRVTETAVVRATSGSAGPIVLLPLVFAPLRIDWKNAPGNRRLEIVSIDPNHGLPKRVEVSLVSREGSASCERFPKGAIQATLVSPSGASISWTWKESKLNEPLLIDLGGDRMREIELYANSDRPAGNSDLILEALEPDLRATRCIALVKLESGRSSDALPALRGRWFYRWNGARSDALVCGVIDGGDETADRSAELSSAARSNRVLSIHWSGQLRPIEELGMTDRSVVELVRCAGRSLETVNRTLRQFRMNDIVRPELGHDASGARRIFCDCSTCEFRPLGP